MEQLLALAKMDGVLEFAFLAFIVAFVIFLLKCPPALREIAFSLRCNRDPESSKAIGEMGKAISEMGKAIGEGLESMSSSIESLKSTEGLTGRNLENLGTEIGEGLKSMGTEIGEGLKSMGIEIGEGMNSLGNEIGSISSSLDSLTQGSLALTHESVMFKCDDETVISLSSVVSTYKEGEGFRVEMSVSGKGSSSKLISQSEHKRMLERMRDMGYLYDESCDKRRFDAKKSLTGNRLNAMGGDVSKNLSRDDFTVACTGV